MDCSIGLHPGTWRASSSFSIVFLLIILQPPYTLDVWKVHNNVIYLFEEMEITFISAFLYSLKKMVYNFRTRFKARI